jgi:hypothetical protein
VEGEVDSVHAVHADQQGALDGRRGRGTASRDRASGRREGGGSQVRERD